MKRPVATTKNVGNDYGH